MNRKLVLIIVLIAFSIKTEGQGNSDVQTKRLIHLLKSASIQTKAKKYETATSFVDSIIGYIADNKLPLHDKKFALRLDSSIRCSVLLMDRIIKQKPSAYSFAVRGTLFGMSGNLIGAIQNLNSAIKLDSTNYVNYYNLAIYLKKNGQKELALKNYNKCIQINKNYGTAYLSRGLLYLDLKKYDKAKSDFEKALSQTLTTKDSSYVLNNIGYMKYLTENYSSSLSYINQSIKLNEVNAFAYKNRALVQIKLGNIALACADLKSASNLGYRDKYGHEVDSLINTHCK